jgi:predicted transposase/invertase (TIGR01784 family)
MSKEERARYERYLMNAAIERNVIDTAKEDGIEKGKIETARNLLKMNVLSMEQISQATGLDRIDVQKLLDTQD